MNVNGERENKSGGDGQREGETDVARALQAAISAGPRPPSTLTNTLSPERKKTEGEKGHRDTAGSHATLSTSTFADKEQQQGGKNKQKTLNKSTERFAIAKKSIYLARGTMDFMTPTLVKWIKRRNAQSKKLSLTVTAPHERMKLSPKDFMFIRWNWTGQVRQNISFIECFSFSLLLPFHITVFSFPLFGFLSFPPFWFYHSLFFSF